MAEPEDTLVELFGRNPYGFSDQGKEVARIVSYYRGMRRNFNLTGKGAPALKPPVNLKDLLGFDPEEGKS